MIDDAQLALFIMLGQTAEKNVTSIPDVVPPQSLELDRSYELALLLPDAVRRASEAAEAYRLFFVFEDFLRDLVVSVLSKTNAENWWNEVPKDVQDQIQALEEREETKIWMATSVRDKASLMTLPQLLKVMDDKWGSGFEDVVMDKSLIGEARVIVHLRNTICHMTTIPSEELSRIKQVMRDWFRMVAP